MVARPCRSRTRAYTAEGAHPGLRRCRLSPCPGGVLASGALGATSRVRLHPESSPPATPRGSSRLCSHTSGLKLTGTCQRRPGNLRPLPQLVRGRVPFIFITRVAIYCVLFIFQVFSLSIVMLFYFIFASRELGVLFIHCADEETEPQKGFVIC